MAKVGCGVAVEMWRRVAKYLDFYYWKGIHVVRTMPTRCRQPGTVPQKRTWEVFLKRWERIRLLVDSDKQAFMRWAGGGMHTWVDVWSRMFMQAENFLPGRWNTIYNVVATEYTWGVRICAKAERDGVATLWGYQNALGDGSKPVRWIREPGCSTPPTEIKNIKMELKEFTAVMPFQLSSSAVQCQDVYLPVAKSDWWYFLSFGGSFKDFGGGVGGLICVRRSK